MAGPDCARHPLEVARDLVGCTVACAGTAAVLVDVEAYHHDDPACHGHARAPTERTRDLFGPPGTLYCYFTYGMHWCANLVTGADGEASAVLLRAGVPIVGHELMRERREAGQRPGARPIPETGLASGPARLVQALAIDVDRGGEPVVDGRVRTLDEALEASAGGLPVIVRDPAAAALAGIDLPREPGSRLVDGVEEGPRVGIRQARDLPWRIIHAPSRRMIAGRA